MSRIIAATEKAEDYRRSLEQFAGDVKIANGVDVIAEAAFRLAEAEGAGALALRTGTLKRLARFTRVRGPVPILYGSKDLRRLRCAQLLWGAHPVPLEDPSLDSWPRDLMVATGLEGSIAWSVWRGDESRAIFSWETGFEGSSDAK